MHSNPRVKNFTLEKPTHFQSRMISPMNQKNVINPVSKNTGSSFLPIGLKNVGNTCFLNSIIQFLFSADKLRTALINSYGKQTNMDTTRFSKLIGKLFAYLEERSTEKDKIKEILQRMVKQLQSMNIQYRRHFQEDALETLLNILNDIERFHPPFIKDFDIQYRVTCLCWTNTVLEKTLSYSLTTCTKCKKKIEKTIINSPTYIIYTNFNKDKVLPERPQKGQSGSERYELTYRLKAQIIYYGNGHSGHYIARREEEGSSFYLDDENVLTVNPNNQRSYEGNRNAGMILLYQLKEKKKQNQRAEEKDISSVIQPQVSSFVKNIETTAPLQFRQNAKRQQKFNQNINSQLKEPMKVQEQLKQAEKIRLNSTYHFEIYVLSRAYIFRGIILHKIFEKRSCYINITNEKRYKWQILNKQCFPYFKQTDTAFDDFCKKLLRQKGNPLEKLGAYIQKHLLSCVLKQYANFPSIREVDKFNSDYVKTKTQSKVFASNTFYETNEKPV